MIGVQIVDLAFFNTQSLGFIKVAVSFQPSITRSHTTGFATKLGSGDAAGHGSAFVNFIVIQS